VKHWESNGHHISQSLFVEKSSPIENEHRNFFSENPEYINCKKSHDLLININQVEI